MMRVSVFLLGLLILPAVARAQNAGSGASPFPTSSTGTIPVDLLTLDGDVYDDRQNKGINNDQCERDVEIVFQLRSLNTAPSGSNYIQLWVGATCQNGENRDQVGETDCKRIAVPDDAWRISNIMQDFKTTVKLLCDVGDGPLDLFFLPTPNTSDAAGNIQAYGGYKLTIDKMGPLAPSNVVAGTGETEIPIRWTVNSVADVFTNHLVWDKDPAGGVSVDDGGASADGECTSSILIEGEDINLNDLKENRNIATKEVPGKVDHTTVSGDELGAQRVAMAVVAADLAGNISKLSNVDCLQVVATDGFWDAYKAAGGEAEPGCGCSTPGTRTSRASGLLPITLLVLAWGVRRRTRKRSGS